MGSKDFLDSLAQAGGGGLLTNITSSNLTVFRL